MKYLESLNKAVSNSGLKRSFIAKELGIKYDTFRRKLKGETPFKMEEVSTLCKIVNIKITEVFENEESNI